MPFLLCFKNDNRKCCFIKNIKCFIFFIYGNFLSTGIVDSLTPLYNIPASRVEKYTLNNIDYYGVWFEVTQISDGITYLSQLAALSESDTIECRTVSWTTEETTI